MNRGDERGRGSRTRRVVVIALLLAVVGAVVALMPEREAPIAPATAPPVVAPPVKDAVAPPPRHRAAPPEPAPVVAPPEQPESRRPVSAQPVAGRVVDAAGAPIPGAEVTMFADRDRRVERVTTAADGTFSFDDGGRREPEVVARRAGFETRTVRAGRPTGGGPAPPVEIRLHPGGAVVGRVRMADGRAPPAPVRVVVGWPVDFLPSEWTRLDRAAASLAPDVRVPAAVTDANGDFRIDGLRDRAWCTLRAGGPGLAGSSSSLVEAEAGGAPVEIVVAPLFAFDVRVVGADGEPPDTSAFLRSLGVGISWSGPYSQQASYSTGSPELRWAGVPDAPTNDVLHVFSAYPVDSAAERVGPFQFRVVLPGYRPATADVWAQRFTGVVAPTEIRLEPAVTAFGTVTVRIDDHGTGFVGALRAMEGNVRSLQYPQILLDYSAGQAVGTDVVPRMAVPLWIASQRPVDVRGVPAGTYVATVDIPLGEVTKADSRREFHVEADTAQEFVVDVPVWSGLALGVDLGPDAPAYRGPIEVTLRRSGTKASYKVNASSAPVTIVGMAPGTYEVTVTQLLRVTMEPFTVELKPNVVTSAGRRRATPVDGPASSRR